MHQKRFSSSWTVNSAFVSRNLLLQNYSLDEKFGSFFFLQWNYGSQGNTSNNAPYSTIANKGSLNRLTVSYITRPKYYCSQNQTLHTHDIYTNRYLFDNKSHCEVNFGKRFLTSLEHLHNKDVAPPNELRVKVSESYNENKISSSEKNGPIPGNQISTKFMELQSLLQEQFFVEFLKEMLNLSKSGLDIQLNDVQRETLYISFFEKINREALVGLLKYRIDLFLENIPMLYHLLSYIWKERALELKELVFTNEVEQYLQTNRISFLLRRGKEPIEELLRQKFLSSSSLQEASPDLDLLQFLEESENTEEQSGLYKENQIHAALIEHINFEMKLLHKVCLFYLDDRKYEVAYEIMRINCTPIDPTNRMHRKVWTHFYSNLVRFGFMGSLEKNFGYRFRVAKHQVLKNSEKRAISKIISQPISHSNISLNALIKDIFYHVMFLEYCALSHNSELALTFFRNHTLPLLQKKNFKINFACEERIGLSLFRSLSHSEDQEKLTNIYEEIFENPETRPCKLYPTSWNQILFAYARQGNHAKAKQIINNQVCKEVDPKHIDHIVETLLKGLIEVGDTRSIYKLFQEMYIGPYGRKPSAYTVTMLIEALVKDENIQYATKVFEQFFCPNQADTSIKEGVLPLRAKPAATIMKAMLQSQQPEYAITFLQNISMKVDWNQCKNVQPIISILYTLLNQCPEHVEDLTSLINTFKEVQTKNQIEMNDS